MDKITIERISKAHPAVRDQLSQIYTEICQSLTGEAACRFTHVSRTWDEQAALYAQGRTQKGDIVTNAAPGYSYHNYGLAVDICLLISKKSGAVTKKTEVSWNMGDDFDGDNVADWAEIVRIFKKYGWEWGGEFISFKDYPHFQKTFGLSTRELMNRYSKKDMANGYVRI